MITEQAEIGGHHYVVTWMPPPFRPPRELTSQAGGICFTHQGEIVLVTSDDESWGLPAGHPKAGESTEDTFVREVLEEACAQVQEFAYIGCQKVIGPSLDADWKHPLHYQARFWARVALLPFSPDFETTGRRLVPPSELLPALNWSTIRCAEAMLSAAVAEEQKRTLPSSLSAESNASGG
jgi:ADP-ribose pyrophosphatase YjhB (NUDIX family)